MEQFRKDIQAILIKKCNELRETDDSIIDYPILEEEIHDAEYIITHVDSSAQFEHKLSAIKAIQQTTTSASIYDTVQKFLEEQGDVKYYFVSFMYGASEKIPSNAVLHTHPIDWQMHCSKSYPGQYVLLHWQEITKEEYDKVKEVI
jgi:hypothetical protein